MIMAERVKITFVDENDFTKRESVRKRGIKSSWLKQSLLQISFIKIFRLPT